MFVKRRQSSRYRWCKDKGEAVLTALPKVNKVVRRCNIKKHQRPNNENLKARSLSIHLIVALDKTVLLDVLLQICRRQKFATNKNQAKCLTNHEGKDKHNG